MFLCILGKFSPSSYGLNFSQNHFFMCFLEILWFILSMLIGSCKFAINSSMPLTWGLFKHAHAAVVVYCSAIIIVSTSPSSSSASSSHYLFHLVNPKFCSIYIVSWCYNEVFASIWIGYSGGWVFWTSALLFSQTFVEPNLEKKSEP